jgi:hypothetical protein
MERIDNYLQLLYLAEEFELLEEGIGDAIKKFTADKTKSFIMKFKNMVKSGNIKGAQKLAKATGLTRVKPKSIDKFMNTKSADYSVAKELANRVLKNSLPGKPKKESIERASTYIAVRSLIANKKGIAPNVTVNAKKHIKDFVTKANKYYDDYDQQADEAEKQGKAPPIPRDSIPDYVVGATIVLGFITIAGMGTWWLYTNLTFIIVLLITVIGVLAAMGSLASIIGALSKKGGAA